MRGDSPQRVSLRRTHNNSVDPDGTARYEPSHVDLQILL